MSTQVAHARAEIDRHFAGDGSSREEQQMRNHVEGCVDCHAYYERHLVLAELDPRALPQKERLRRGLGLRAPVRWSLVPTLAGATAILALVLVLGPRVPRATDAGFTARGAAPASAELLVYRVASDRPERVERAITVGDELAFAYRTPADKDRLMIFGVDEHRHVYWYHPAWRDAAEDPRAIPALPGAAVHELREAVRHDLDGGRLRIVALFTDRPLSVREVEAALATGPESALPGAVTSSVELEVRR